MKSPRWWAAVHEIGHFLVAADVEVPACGVIRARSEGDGMAHFRFPAAPKTEADFIARFAVLYGGMTAGAVAGDPDPCAGAGGDCDLIAEAAQLATAAGFDADALESRARKRAHEALDGNPLLLPLARELFTRKRISAAKLTQLALSLAPVAAP